MFKRGYEFSFAWFFTIIVGATIIFLAVYAATQLVDLKRTEEETERGKQLGILLTPLGTTLEEGKLATIVVPDETRLYNECSTRGSFGSQEISTAIKSGIGEEEWRNVTGVESSFYDKYIFSGKIVEADKNFYVFTKPLKLPFKIAELTILWSDKEVYCFTGLSNTWSELETEIFSDLKPKNVFKETPSSPCPQETTKKICFGSSSPQNCYARIDSNQEQVIYQSGDSVNYVKSTDLNDKYALLYAAIFSDKPTYECQVKRLMSRAANLANLYQSKSDYLKSTSPAIGGCRSDLLVPYLNVYKSSAISASADPQNLDSVYAQAQELEAKNAPLNCKLF